MITAMSLTNGTLTVIVDGGAQILTARQDHPRWTEIQDAYKTENHARLLTLLSLQAVVEEYSVGQLSLTAAGVTFGGHPMHTVDADRVMAFLRDKLPYKPLANYIARKMANPSARAIKEMYSFLEHKNMTLTPDGHFIAYKGVQNDFYSVHGNKETIVLQGTVNEQGQILNEIGAVIEVNRSSVDDDFRQGCSFGLHAGSLAYAKGWGQRVVLVEIDPADVVSVPEDCNCQKLRCCKYKVVGEYTGPMPDTYTTEFSPDPVEDDDDPCDGCNGNDCDCGCNDEVVDVPVVTEKICQRCNHFESKCDCLSEADSPLIVDDIVAPRVIAVLKEQLGLPWIEPAASLVELGCDELDIVEITMSLETEFGIQISEDDAASFGSIAYSVSNLIEYIRARTVKVNVVSPTTELEQAAVDAGLFGGTSVAFRKDPNPTIKQDPNYLKGIGEGVEDRAKEVSPRFLQGDQLSADSDAHAQFISGYLVGYL